MCVCVSVCLSEHAILAVRAIRSITKDAIVLSIRFAAIFANLTLNMMASFVILIIARTARIACLDRHTYRQTDTHTHTHETTTVTLSAHARRGLINSTCNTVIIIVKQNKTKKTILKKEKYNKQTNKQK